MKPWKTACLALATCLVALPSATGKITLARDAGGWHIEKESWNESVK